MADPSRVQELLLHWQELHHQGREVSASSLCADCPELAEELAPGPPRVYLTSLDLSNPREFERAYQLFLTGALPEAPRKGAFRSLWEGFSGAETPAEEDEAFVPPQPMRALPKVGRNASCPCGSGKKYKRCCGR